MVEPRAGQGAAASAKRRRCRERPEASREEQQTADGIGLGAPCDEGRGGRVVHFYAIISVS